MPHQVKLPHKLAISLRPQCVNLWWKVSLFSGNKPWAYGGVYLLLYCMFSKLMTMYYIGCVHHCLLDAWLNVAGRLNHILMLIFLFFLNFSHVFVSGEGRHCNLDASCACVRHDKWRLCIHTLRSSAWQGFWLYAMVRTTAIWYRGPTVWMAERIPAF